MALYDNKDPSTAQTLLKKRKLVAPKLFQEEAAADQEVDTAAMLLNSSAANGFKDYNTGDVTAADIYPGSALSPVRVDGVGGVYGSIPVVTGGQVLYPTALSHKRNAAKLEADSLEQEREAKVKDLFGMQLAAPAMAPAIQKFYFDEVQKRVGDVYATLGREKATAALGDITNPITQNVLKPYADYKQAVKASFDVQDAMKTVVSEANKGERVMSAATKQELKDIQDGTWLKKNNPDGTPRTIADYAKIPNRFQTYATLDAKFKDLKEAGVLEQDIMETIERGVTVDGKKLNSLNGAQFLDQITEKSVSSPRIQALKQSMLNDPDLSPDITEQDIDARFNSLAKSVAHQITSVAARSSSGSGDNKAAEKELAIDKRYADITENLLNGNSQAFNNVGIGKKHKEGSVTNVKYIPAGTKVKGQGADKDKVGLTTEPKLLIEYSIEETNDAGFKIARKKQDEVTGNEEIIRVANDWYDYNKEGTAGPINREDMSIRFKSDDRFKGGSSAKKERTVVKTGTYNGKKVIQYSDGTVEYAD